MAHPQRLMPLEAEQLQASDPKGNIWLSASAGTGKTHVLTARVLRLLLNRAAPESILCLTFTKAGAAEMSERINQRLARWVIQLNDDELREELQALGAHYDRETLALARTLFARVLDAPGGLRIQTIHSFCQSLLTAFPVEAGLIPGFHLIEGREEAVQAKKTLTGLLDNSTPASRRIKEEDIILLAEKLGEPGAEDYIYQCRFHHLALNSLGEAIESKVKHALDLPSANIQDILEEACDDDHFDFELLRHMAEANEKWGTKTADDNLAIIQSFVAASPHERVSLLQNLKLVPCTKAGKIREKQAGLFKVAPSYKEWMTSLKDSIDGILSLKERSHFAQFAIAALRTGQAYSQAWQESKKEAGLVDFNDMIESSITLLLIPGIGDWVRYKLDRRTDHILVDEAQDTNRFQWAIIKALAEDFFSGDSAKSVESSRSIFAVGDFKQAIYGFQGTDPQAFIQAHDEFSDKSQGSGREILDLSLNRSFRSTPPILTVVDNMLADIETHCGGIGIDREALQPHQSAKAHLGGAVVLLQPISDYQEEDDNSSSTDNNGEGEDQLENGELELAIRLARQIEAWLDPKKPLYLEALGRPVQPRDILILVRNRGRLASLIVGCLHAQKIPVAGLDRLTLTTPLAVCDLLSAIRFVLQPDDDLTLACLLVSPLIGWDQDRLYKLAAHRAPKETLFDRLRKSEAEKETWDVIRDWLSKADFITPYRFLEMLLSGKEQGRQKLLERLGEEARDPINELLNAALLLESETTPSFQRFLDWFDSGDVEIKRDPSVRQNTVRIMTVHGAKGLQAPVVILADATRDPTQSNGFKKEIIEWPLDENSPSVPIPMPNDTDNYLPFADIITKKKTKDLQEHWRLLYVAATRAEEYLVITGHLGSKSKNKPPEKSWYACAVRAMSMTGIAWQEDSTWQQKAVYHVSGQKTLDQKRPDNQPPASSEAMPAWIKNKIPEEPKPVYPLRPSDLVRDNTSNPPPDGASLNAAKRGTLLHALFERLPMLPPEQREVAGLRWLKTAGITDPLLRNNLAKDACAVMNNPDFVNIFSEKSLAEAPIAAQVGDHVISGTVDRLWIDKEQKRVHIVDFKTGRRVPASEKQVSDAYLRQMAAYVVALEKIFPDYIIEASLLYTSGPKLVSFEQSFLHEYFSKIDEADIQSDYLTL
ncbi:MAG: double-strand break repair helicase AddA [Zymomonas mobilis]|uniref:DNA 3'-5' helicase n=1 Tax=Zymomonas mobilis TaxID=542 RepID=A0A542W1N0_ZYMMB|nr:double-strand break repair helicase AddA [Zymomonas mobilis]TQL17484.1 DNA helicase/exodeoxyribonuclease V subunit A [Zymomonas mobilis]